MVSGQAFREWRAGGRSDREPVMTTRSSLHCRILVPLLVAFLVIWGIGVALLIGPAGTSTASTMLWLGCQGVLGLVTLTGVGLWVLRRHVVVPIRRLMRTLDLPQTAGVAEASVLAAAADPLDQLAETLDATRQRGAEREARDGQGAEELRSRNQAFDEHSGISETDVSGRILYVNQRFCELSGYSQEQLLGMDHRILKSGRHGPEFWCGVFADLGSRGVWRGEVCNRRPNGEEYWISTTKLAVRNGAGAVARYIAISNDITDRVRASQDAERSQRLLEVFIEHAPAAVAMFDQEMRYLSYSQKWVTDFGLEGVELLGRCHYDVFRELPDSWRAVYERCLKGAVERCDEDPFVRASGHVQWLRWEVRPWPAADGTVGGVVMCTVDITGARRQADDLERARAQAEGAARAKADFLAVMSHELRTPMNGVLGFANLLSDTPLDAEQRSYVQTIRQSGDTLLGLLNDLLDFSKAESGRMLFEPAVTSPRLAAEDVVELLVPRACEAGIEVVLMADAEPPLVLADPARLRQVLTNLVGNAIKFTKKGEICIRIEPVGGDPSGGFVRFSITDTGIGVAADVLPELFARFRQADASISRRYGGTGLGLAISKQLVEAMGGEIGATSQPGLGSTFWFTVPGAPPGADPSTGDGMEPMPRLASGLRVLAVVDRERPGELLGRLLEEAGVRHAIRKPGPGACAGLDWLDSSGRADWDVVVLDLMTPPAGWEDCLTRWRGNRGKSTPALVVFEGAAPGGGQPPLGRIGDHVLGRPLVRARAFLAKLAQLGTPLPTLAKAGPALAGAVPSGPVGAGGAHRRVLVVEDNAVNQLITRSLVERLGHRVDVAGNGLEAVEMILQIEYDLVLMDCQMPEMDGFEATQAIRRWEAGHGRNRRMPIIGVTASVVAEVEERCRECGMDGLLRKPLREAVLAAELGRFLQEG